MRHQRNRSLEMNEKPSLKTQMVEQFELPKDLMLGAPLLHIYGRSEAYIENFKNMIEFTDKLIKVQTKQCRIMILGKKLEIESFCGEEMHIIGKIEEIKYY